MERSTASEPLVINLCPTGIVPTKAMIASVPISVEEVVDDVGEPTHRPDVVGEIVRRLRKDHLELVIGVTCSGPERVRSRVEGRGTGPGWRRQA